MNAPERQRPPAGELYLDHLAHFVPDLGAAAAVWEKLGFAVTPVSAHQASGKPAGTSNRCVMLEEGYLELLAPTMDTPNAQRVRDRMKRFVGVHLACFGTPDAAAEHARLGAHGFEPEPLVSLERKIETGESVRFSVVYVPPGKMAEGRVQYCEHLTPAQVWHVKRARERAGSRARVIAINNAYALAPWADVLYFADLDWWQRHREEPAYRAFQGAKATIEPTGFSVDEAGVYLLHNAGELGLSAAPNALATGGNSGHQALNLAVLAGASRVLLLGYDMGHAGERTHWHRGHPGRTDRAAFGRFRNAAASTVAPLAALGVEVINCSGGALECFPRAPIESVLPDPPGAALSP